jgi:hypothetical protein
LKFKIKTFYRSIRENEEMRNRILKSAETFFLIAERNLVNWKPIRWKERFYQLFEEVVLPGTGTLPVANIL